AVAPPGSLEPPPLAPSAPAVPFGPQADPLGLDFAPRDVGRDLGGGTGDGPVSGRIEASCTPDDNPLRATCTIEASPATTVSVAFAPVDGARPVRLHRSEVDASTHVVPLYLMTADTEYAYEASRGDGLASVRGTFQTGPLPVRYPELTVQGVSSAPLMAASSPCGNPVVAIFDSQGDLLWLQNTARGTTGRHEGSAFTEDGTVLSVFRQGGMTTVSEHDLAGRELVYLQEGGAFDEALHHDAFKKNGLIYALAHETFDVGGGRLALMDGFYIFDRNGLVAEWWLSDHWQPPAGLVPVTSQGAHDLTHGNAIWVDDQDDVYLSLRDLHSVVKVRGLGPGFGDVAWVLAGGVTPWASDFDVQDLPGELGGFFQQHNVHQLPTGEFAMFDNRMMPFERSRLLVFDVDPATLTMRALEAYDLDDHCWFQGGAWFTPVGNPVATCSHDRRAFEFSRGSTGVGTEPAPTLWEGQLSCSGGTNNFVPRFVPLDW
ncbi:MAG: aryl-sulfate sulfotransferase, partial [Myxococcota bacterium]